MAQPSNFNPSSTLPKGTRRCPVCGKPMSLSVIEPTYQKGYDVRTFECLSCTYSELALVNSADEIPIAP
jgi:hypothetical protein